MGLRSKEFWITQGGRERLIEFINGDSIHLGASVPFSYLANLRPSGNELSFIWTKQPLLGATLPSFIVGNNDAINDLISWSSSYLRAVGPVTSYTRLFTPRDLEISYSDFGSTRFLPFTKAFVGLIIGEISYLAKKAISLEDVTIAACQSTLTFARTKALFANLPHYTLLEIPKIWERTRQLTEQKASNIDLSPIIKAFENLDSLADDNPYSHHSEILRSISKGNFRDLEEYLEIPRIYVPNGNRNLLGTPLEERLKIYDKAIPEIISDKKIPLDQKGFLIGLLAAFCRPGSFEAIGLLSPYIENIPSCALWFGIIQGLMPNNDILLKSGGLGWRIARDFNSSDDLFENPRCDISYRELEIFSRFKQIRPIKTETRGKLLVEIAPGITVPFKNLDNREIVEPPKKVEKTQASLPYIENENKYNTQIKYEIVNIEKNISLILSEIQALKEAQVKPAKKSPATKTKKK